MIMIMKRRMHGILLVAAIAGGVALGVERGEAHKPITSKYTFNQDVLPIFQRMERYEGGSDKYRGRTGLLRVTDTPRNKLPLLEKIIEAAGRIGLPFNPDFNGALQLGCGLFQVTQKNGRR